MTVIKRRPNGLIEVVEAAFIVVDEGESVFSQVALQAVIEIVPAWAIGKTYKVGDVVSYDGYLWRVLQAHTSQLGWNPRIAFSLFTETWASGTIPNWKQPLGAHDAYPIKFEVWHLDRIWVSDVDANVWEPNSVADTWTLRDDQEPLPEPETDEWQPNTAYIGANTNPDNPDIVTYNGIEYSCRQSHTSQVGWEPSAVPALWLRI